MIPDTHNHSHGQCTVCLETMNTPSFNKKARGRCCFREGNKVVRLSCGHAYHSECMDGQLTSGTSTCPNCQKPISERDISFIGKRLKKNYVRRGAQDVAREVMDRERQNTDRTSRENASLWGCDARVSSYRPLQPENMHQNYHYQSSSRIDDLFSQLLLSMLFTQLSLLSAMPRQTSAMPRQTFAEPASSSEPYRFQSSPPWLFAPVQEALPFSSFHCGFGSSYYPETIRTTIVVF